MLFDDAFARVVGLEGRYTPPGTDDPGGETRFGVSKRAYPQVDIRNLTLPDAKAIYLRDYWLKAGCDKVPDVLSYDLFDMAVNQGVGVAIRTLQDAVGVEQDGVLGPVTLAAIAQMDTPRLLFRFVAARLVAYTEDAGWPEYGRGWVRRVASNMMLY